MAETILERGMIRKAADPARLIQTVEAFLKMLGEEESEPLIEHPAVQKRFSR